jgi:arsenate reductase
MIKARNVSHVGHAYEPIALPLEKGLPRGILFVCVHNSARSQMAEAFAKRILPPSALAFSAGSQPTQINPYAQWMM